MTYTAEHETQDKLARRNAFYNKIDQVITDLHSVDKFFLTSDTASSPQLMELVDKWNFEKCWVAEKDRTKYLSIRQSLVDKNIDYGYRLYSGNMLQHMKEYAKLGHRNLSVLDYDGMSHIDTKPGGFSEYEKAVYLLPSCVDMTKPIVCRFVAQTANNRITKINDDNDFKDELKYHFRKLFLDTHTIEIFGVDNYQSVNNQTRMSQVCFSLIPRNKGTMTNNQIIRKVRALQRKGVSSASVVVANEIGCSWQAVAGIVAADSRRGGVAPTPKAKPKAKSAAKKKTAPTVVGLHKTHTHTEWNIKTRKQALSMLAAASDYLCSTEPVTK